MTTVDLAAIEKRAGNKSGYYTADIKVLLALVRDLRGALVEVQRCPRCESCQSMAADVIAARCPDTEGCHE